MNSEIIIGILPGIAILHNNGNCCKLCYITRVFNPTFRTTKCSRKDRRQETGDRRQETG
ncbi:MAG: hypothetical protein AB4080_16865 [Trichodesmium sp.]